MPTFTTTWLHLIHYHSRNQTFFDSSQHFVLASVPFVLSLAHNQEVVEEYCMKHQHQSEQPHHKYHLQLVVLLPYVVVVAVVGMVMLQGMQDMRQSDVHVVHMAVEALQVGKHHVVQQE